MQTNKIRFVIATAIIALSGILFMQGFLILKSWQVHVNNYRHRVQQAAMHSAHRLEKGQIKQLLREHRHHRGNRNGHKRHHHDTKVVVDIIKSENQVDSGFQHVEQKIIIVNEDTVKKIVYKDSNQKTSNKTKVAIWNEQLEELHFEDLLDDSSLIKKIKNIPLDSILASELNKEEIDYNFTYEIITSKDIDSHHKQKHKREKGQFVVPLFRGTLKDQPVFLKLHLDKHKADFPLWFILMVSFSILFSGLMIWAFWYVVNGLLKQKRISEIKSDFINNMTHEFKTPISTISLAVDSIDHDKIKTNPEKIGYYSSIIRTENKRMNKQVERVLQVAQLEKGELIFEKNNVDIQQVIREVVNSFDLILSQKKGTITSNESQSSIIIIGDESHLFNVINNIIDNAIKYCKTEPNIDLKIVTESGFCILKIKDNGIGMTAEEQKHLFSKFYRAESGNLHNVKGFGLGLSYVKFVIEKHNGTIEVASKKNEGSTFTIKLPMA